MVRVRGHNGGRQEPPQRPRCGMSIHSAAPGCKAEQLGQGKAPRCFLLQLARGGTQNEATEAEKGEPKLCGFLSNLRLPACGSGASPTTSTPRCSADKPCASRQQQGPQLASPLPGHSRWEGDFFLAFFSFSVCLNILKVASQQQKMVIVKNTKHRNSYPGQQEETFVCRQWESKLVEPLENQYGVLKLGLAQ